MSKIVVSISKLGDVLLFGGTFDPVQNAHINIAKTALNECNYNTVVFIPSKRNPLKNHAPIASDKDRIEMLSLALEGYDSMVVWPYEINSQKSPSYTVDTIIEARKQVPSTRLGFLTGSDVISELPKWREPHKILSVIEQWVVANRDDEEVNLKQTVARMFGEVESKKFYWLSNSPTLISSSEIRKNIYSDTFVKDTVPYNVLTYITEKNIYR